MPTELAKTFEPQSTQEQAQKIWADANAYHAKPTDPGTPYSIVIPPPNVTAALHLGHALNNTLQDILTRYHRMTGDNTCWLPGTDHAGIATQTVVEKRVLAEEGKRRTDFAREEFVKKIQAWKDQYEAHITGQLKAMGCSCDWQRQAFTMDEPRAKAVREAFFRLFKDGLIYRGKRLVNWDPVTQTALADDEVEMEEVDGHFYYLRYPLAEEGSGFEAAGSGGPAYVTVATTRPETMLGDTAVAINPKDPRAAALKGKKVILPIVNRVVPIVEDEYVVMPVQYGGDEKDPKAQLATGFLKVTPAHDPNDYEIGRRHGLDVINVMAPDASISDKHGWSDVGEAGFVVGKTREEARKLVVDWFKRNGLLEEIKPYRHSVGHSYRSHVAIEPYLSDQWYCKVTDERMAGAALRAMAREEEGLTPSPARASEITSPKGESRVGEGGGEGKAGTGPHPNPLPHATTLPGETNQSARAGEGTWEGQLRFYPARYAKTFQSWHENIRDWCISRQLWWGHRIPVWIREHDPASSNDIDIHPMTPLEVAISDARRSDNPPLSSETEKFYVWQSETMDGGRIREYVCIAPGHPAIETSFERLGFVQDPDVLDTWFSSGLWPLSTLGWPNDTRELNTWNPTNVLCTAREIITLWVSRMTMFNIYFRNTLPFRDVFIHAMIQDGHGQKMSKSLGNGVDPMDIIGSHGADAMRFTLAHMATNTQDVRMPVDLVDPHSGETFTPKYVTDSAGYQVAAPIQESPKDTKKKMVSSYGYATGNAQPTPDMPVAKNTSAKFDLGRNFCNKLWNASRFVLMQLESMGKLAAEAASPGPDEAKWSLADRWIVSRFNRTVVEINEAIASYRFDNYARAAYDFFWRDFCDWYVEATKPAMKDPVRAAQTAHVLAAVLDGSLRLLHPVIPFITEIVYQRLNEVRPQRGLPGRLECSASPLLIKAPWPTVGSFAEAAEHIFPRIQEVIVTIRNIRNQAQVNLKQKVNVSFNAPAEPTRQINENREMIETLATCTISEIGPAVAAPAGAVKSTAGGIEIYVQTAAPGADAAVSEKRKADLTKQIATMKARLSNASYISKAPLHLVQQTKEQLAAAEAELAKLQ